jgi:hypothetical protein
MNHDKRVTMAADEDIARKVNEITMAFRYPRTKSLNKYTYIISARRVKNLEVNGSTFFMIF